MPHSRPHLLLLHGAIGASHQLAPLAEALQENYTVHTLNFSGHGGEAFPQEAFSISLFTKEVMHFLRHQNIDISNIFGYSMGGYVALHLAKHHPQQVGKIVTLATKFHWDEATAARETKMLDAATIQQKVPAFAEQLKHRHHPNDWTMVLDKTKDMLQALGVQNTLHPAACASITTPSLLLLGENDKMVTVEETIDVQQAMPNAQFRSLPGTAHPIEQVDTGMLARTIHRFMGAR